MVYMVNKSNFSNKDSQKCPNHPDSPVMMEPESGQNFCTSCGELVSTSEQQNNISRHARGEDLGSRIPQPTDTQHDGRRIKEHSEVGRWTKSIRSPRDLHRYHKEVSDHDFVKTKHVSKNIDGICQKFNVSKNIKEEAMKYYPIIKKYGLCSNQNPVCIAGECIFLASRNFGPHGISIKKISEWVNEDYKTLFNFHNKIITEISKNNIKELKIDVDFRIDHIKYAIFAYPEDAISQKLKIECHSHLDNEKFDSILSGNSVTSIAAGIIYVIATENDIETNPKRIAKFYKISESTVRNQAKKIADNWGIELTDKRKKQ